MKTYRSPARGNAPIYFGMDARELLLGEVDELAPDRVFMLCDRTVEALFTEEIRNQLPSAIPLDPVIFNEGEENKNLGTLQHIAGDLLRAGVTDRSLVLNVGGGVTLNLGGLAASLLGHGVRFAHVATTSTAQWQVVTSSRQALNFTGVRNALGVYRAPAFSIADPFFLDSEPERQTMASFVDLARLALVCGGDAFEAVGRILSRSDFEKLPALEESLRGAIELTLKLGEGDPDEREADTRSAYAAEIARALESLAEGRLLPGEARYYAIRISTALAFLLGLTTAGDLERQEELLARLRVATPFPAHLRTEHLVYKLHGNDKTKIEPVRLALLSAPGRPAGDPQGGEPVPRVAVGDDALAEAIERVRADAVV